MPAWEPKSPLFLDAWLRPPRKCSGNLSTSPDSFRLLRDQIKTSDPFAVFVSLSSSAYVQVFTPGWSLLACDPPSSQLEPGMYRIAKSETVE